MTTVTMRVRAWRQAQIPPAVSASFMSVPPYREDPEEVRPYFRKLRLLREKLGEIRSPCLELRELSMGMSHDYKVAIEEGASIVRIGTALFGARRD